MTSQKNVTSLIIALLACIPIFAQDLRFEEKNGTLTLYEDHLPRFSYQKETRSESGQYPRANYIHPLYGMNGENLTEDFPEDHPHHRGIFWTWHQLFAKGKRVADPWLCEGIRWKVDSALTEIRDNSATLKTVVYWLTGEGPDEAVIKEEGLISYVRREDHYEIDFDITLTALVDGVQLGGSEDEKGYGGFSARIKTPDVFTFFSEKGKVIPENTPVKAGGWIEIIPDHDPDQKEQTGIVLMCHPAKLPSFRGWILRKHQSMQNAAFPGREPIAIPKEKPLRFRNRLVVHQGTLDKDDIKQIYRDFVRSR
ncbi:DUF6807 family protein [Sinomicrobium weinanense]|uniref:PmoA family protein n=1 Tax=Sinomicrobium weinanense TaxID=2842200 RepID=A0A926Q0B8_9FLAO|nr:DUF6807 family protein [Sinomicrobium weinanense]MBC9794678.1 PmoA family protein [Sinomicrobium weinanense]MBU3124163.1 PmoA family protein [Sinomicrobium weinanense]